VHQLLASNNTVPFASGMAEVCSLLSAILLVIPTVAGVIVHTRYIVLSTTTVVLLMLWLDTLK